MRHRVDLLDRSSVARYLKSNFEPYQWYSIMPNLHGLVFYSRLESKGYIVILPSNEHPIGMKRLIKLTGAGRLVAGYIKSFRRPCGKCGTVFTHESELWNLCDECEKEGE